MTTESQGPETAGPKQQQPYVEITDRMARCPTCNATDWVTNFQAGRHDHSPARS